MEFIAIKTAERIITISNLTEARGFQHVLKFQLNGMTIHTEPAKGSDWGSSIIGTGDFKVISGHADLKFTEKGEIFTDTLLSQRGAILSQIGMYHDDEAFVIRHIRDIVEVIRYLRTVPCGARLCHMTQSDYDYYVTKSSHEARRRAKIEAMFA